MDSTSVKWHLLSSTFWDTRFYPAFGMTLHGWISLLTPTSQILKWKGDVLCFLLLQSHPVLQLDALGPAGNPTSED